ncbi:MAG: M6 family metalloprotease domain-containing protein, partial [Nitrospirae bacterium]
MFCIVRQTEAVPAAPVVHILKQPDGTSFKAKKWGDEWSHGWETLDGYTIVKDKKTKYWHYATKNQKGSLVPSGRIVGRHGPPAFLTQHLRPKKTLKQKAPLKRIQQTPTLTPSQKTIPPTGTANIPVILITFSDRQNDNISTPSDFENILFGTGNYSMKDYFEEVSYSAFSVSSGPSGVRGWYVASNTHDYYGTNYPYGYDRWPGDLVYEAVQQADQDIDFSTYDNDHDCYVDVVVIVHQGQGEEASDNSTDIWSHMWSLSAAKDSGYSNHGAYTTNDNDTACPSGYIVDEYTIQPEQFQGGLTTIGVFAHEYGHALGLPDLYDTDYSSQGIGKWGLMASGVWNSLSRPGDRPAHPCAWSKFFLGWVTPQEVTSSMFQVQIQPASTSADVYQFLSGGPRSGEYFLIENRDNTTGFDIGLPGSGLLVWHIDGSVITNNLNTVNNHECYPSGPSCAKQHYGVALVQADNMWNLEKGQNSGDSGDPFPGFTNKTSFTDSTSPSSGLYNGDDSGIGIENISTSGPDIIADLVT